MSQTRFSGPVKSDNGFIFGTTPDVNSLAPGQLAWSSIDGTINAGLDYGVTMQIGQEVYARVQNQTGSLIPNGTVVGFAGVGTNNTLSVAPYLANGGTPTLYILGVMTHDLPDSGQVGYCTVWGHVRDLNTNPFNAGDILYASPSSAGAFTNVKPTAPNAVVPVAAVLSKSATNGEIFVRPTIEQQKYYGSFAYKGTSQTPSAVYTPKAVLIDTTEFANGVSVGSPASRIVVANSGLYRFSFSLQIESNSSSSKKLWIWPRVGGVNVPDSNSEVTFSGSGTAFVPAWSWTLSMSAGSYFEIMFAGDSTDILIASKPAATGANGTTDFARPAVPGVLLEVTQIQQ